MTQSLPTPPAIRGRVGKMRVQNGRYNDGVRTWQRTTNLLTNIETDTRALDDWKANTLSIGLARRPDLVLGVAAAAQFDENGKLTKDSKNALWGLRRQAMDAGRASKGSNQGNAIHTATERYDMGETVEQIGLPYPFNADLQAYATLVKAMGIRAVPDMIERTIKNERADTAGTFDRMAEVDFLAQAGIVPAGQLVVIDVKTEERPLLNLMHICPQLAVYANGDGLFVPAPTPDNEFAGTYEDMPNVSRVVGLVIHVRDGRATPYLVDLVAGWKSALRAREQRDELKASKTKLGEDGAWAMLLDVPLPPATTLVQDAAAPALAAARVRAENALTALSPAPSALAIAAAPEAEPWHLAVNTDCGNCSSLVASATRVDGTEADYPCQQCRKTAMLNRPEYVAGNVETAVRGADGLVRWEATPAPTNADEARGLSLLTALHDAVLTAGSMEALAFMYDEAARQAVPWTGMIAEAAQQRAAIVQCPDRSFHAHPNVVKCACGWKRGVAA